MEHSNEELLAALYQTYLSENIRLREENAKLMLTVQKLQDAAEQREADATPGGSDATQE